MSHYLMKNVLPSKTTRIFLFKKQFLVKYLVVPPKLFKNNNFTSNTCTCKDRLFWIFISAKLGKINPFFVCRGKLTYYPLLGSKFLKKQYLYQNTISSVSPGKNVSIRGKLISPCWLVDS